MRHPPRPWTHRVALTIILAAAIGLGGWWLVLQAYPLNYRTILTDQANQFGLDPYLVAAVIRVESGFRAQATSKQGARGLMQIMPETGEWAAAQMKIPYSPDMLYDPEYNIRIGSWYLAELRKEFGDDNVLILAAYNGGRTNVRQWLDERQWTGEHHTLDQIPFKETRQYVAKVLRDLALYHRIYSVNSLEERAIADVGTLTLRR